MAGACAGEEQPGGDRKGASPHVDADEQADRQPDGEAGAGLEPADDELDREASEGETASEPDLEARPEAPEQTVPTDENVFGGTARMSRIDALTEQVESIPGEPGTVVAGQNKRKGHGRKAVLVGLVVMLLLLAAAIAALAIDDGNRTQKVPSTTLLDGRINVSGLTADELDRVVTARVENGFTTKVEVNVAGTGYAIDLADVGKLDAQATVDAAFAPYDVPFYQRYWDRIVTLFGGERPTYQIATSIAPDQELLTEQVKAIAEKADKKAKDAGYEYSKGKLVTTKAQDGIEMDVDATIQAIDAAVATDTTAKTARVDAVVKTTKAKNTKPGKAIFVDCSACELYLYDNGKVVYQTPCSPGRSGYATPKGDWTLSGKIKNPTWTNPGSDWAANMPETIGPGRGNPMGLRKLAVSCGGGIFIHGTENIGALGSPDSHGCIRIANDEVVKLYDMVSEGIPIIIR